MRRSGRFYRSWGVFSILGGLVMLVASALVYLDDSNGAKNAFVTGGVILLVVCLFWAVGGLLAGQSILKNRWPLIGKLFVGIFILILIILETSILLDLADPQTHILIHLAKDLMLAGWAFWAGALLMYRGNLASL